MLPDFFTIVYTTKQLLTIEPIIGKCWKGSRYSVPSRRHDGTLYWIDQYLPLRHEALFIGLNKAGTSTFHQPSDLGSNFDDRFTRYTTEYRMTFIPYEHFIDLVSYPEYLI